MKELSLFVTLYMRSFLNDKTVVDIAQGLYCGLLAKHQTHRTQGSGKIQRFYVICTYTIKCVSQYSHSIYLLLWNIEVRLRVAQKLQLLPILKQCNQLYPFTNYCKGICKCIVVCGWDERCSASLHNPLGWRLLWRYTEHSACCCQLKRHSASDICGRRDRL